MLMRALIATVALAMMLAGCAVQAPKTAAPPAPEKPAPAQPAAEGVKVGSLAPRLTGKTWFTADGKEPDLKGKVYFLDFWFENCGGCVAAIPEVKALAAKYADKGLVVIGPSLDEASRVTVFKEKHGIEYALLSDALPAAEAFGADLFPAMYLVGRNGKVLWMGNEKSPDFEKILEDALAAK